MSDLPSDYARAVSLFRDFQHRAPRRGEIVQLGGFQAPVTALEVGTAVSVGYKALGDGKKYYHEFEGRHPRLFVSADGLQAFFEGGIYQFTSRGFLK